MKFNNTGSLLEKVAACLCAGLIVQMLMTGMAVAQEVAVARTVRNIDVKYVGSPTVTKDRILSRLSTKVGDPFSQAKVDEDIKKLFASGDVEDIKILAEPQGESGIRLTVVVQTRAMLGDVAFNGNAALSEKDLRKRVDLATGASIDIVQVQEGRNAIQEHYRKKGYPEVYVEYKIGAPNKQGFSTLTFIIDEGGQGVLRKVEFVGNEVFKARVLRDQMEQKQKPLIRLPFSSKKGRIDRDMTRDDERRVADYYKNHGYLDATATAVRVRVDSKNVDLVITIDEGIKYSVGNVSVNGVRVMSVDTDILKYVRLKGGNTYSKENLDYDVKMIRDLYGSQGYADTIVAPRLTGGGGADVVNVAYDVTEGRKFNLGKVNIAGNQKTQDKVIRREMAVNPGEVYDTVRIDATKQRLMNLGYFSSVDVLPVDTTYIDVKDLNITVTEQPTGRLEFRAGFSSVYDLVGTIKLTQANFDLGNWPSMTGAGQKIPGKYISG